MKSKRIIPPGCVTSEELARRTGATLRQLQWWAETELLVPLGGDGQHRRLYHECQVETCIRILQLRRAHVSLSEIRQLLQLHVSYSNVVKISKPRVIGDTLYISG